MLIAGPMLAHKAEDEGIGLRGNHCGQSRPRELRSIAGIIYTNPELAGVGLTEDQAKEQGSMCASANSRSAPTAARFAAMTLKEW